MSKYNLVIEYEERIKEVERELAHNMERYRHDEISAFIMVMIETALNERLERLRVVLKVHKELAKW